MPTLTPGMKAPKLEVSGWLKYDAPEAKAGKFRVVEFWATWCGPCKTSIPHITELAHKYKDKVDFVGVSVWEREGTSIDDLKKFVSEMGEKMDYRVAYDTQDKKMAMGWMKAAGQNGIPASFLLNDKDEILWVGHPMALAKPLEQALDGTLDVKDVKEKFLKAAAEEEEMTKAQQAIANAGKTYATDKAGAEKVWDETSKKFPQLASFVTTVRLQTYPAGSPENAALVDKLFDSGAQGQQTLASYAFSQAKKNPTISRSIADRITAKSENPIALYYAALAYNSLEAYSEAVKAFDNVLVKYESSKMSLNGFKEAVEKARATAVAKIGDKG